MVTEKLGISENFKMFISRPEKNMKIYIIFEMWLKSQDMSVMKKKSVIILTSKMFNWLEMIIFNLQDKSISKN